jgi:protein TonB
MLRGGRTILAVVTSVVMSGVIGLPFAQSQDQTSPPAAKSEAAPHPQLPQRVRVSQGVMQGLTLTKVPPHYPEKARKKRIQGIVLLHVLIGKDGNVETAELVSGHPMLAPAAIDAVKQWKYKPYLLNGNPIVVETEIQVNFTLSGN